MDRWTCCWSADCTAASAYRRGARLRDERAHTAATSVGLGRFPLADVLRSGRVNRLTYAIFCVGGYVASIIVALVLYVASNAAALPEIGILFLYAVILGWFWLHIVTAVKRLHDQNHSGWLVLLALIPVAGLVLFIMCLFVGGSDDDNEYGEPPNPGFAL